MIYTDIHIHALYGVDDGAKTQEHMQKMIEASYLDGVRAVCFTPHFHPGYFGDTGKMVDEAFVSAQKYAREHYPQMRLFLGNELRYSKDCISWIDSGECRTLNKTDVVLVDFLFSEPGRNIVQGLYRILNAGYRPLLAHVERYENLKKREVVELSRNGVWMQCNADSIVGENGFLMKWRANTFLREHLIDFVSSDAHGTTKRPPGLSDAYSIIEKKYGGKYARAICYKNALKMLGVYAEEGMVVNHE